MIRQLLEKLLTEENSIYIQTHNFPDPDAVASAFGLQQLLLLKGVETKIIYDGVIQRTALSNMISSLSIEMYHSDDLPISRKDKIIIVDGCKWNKNVTDLAGYEIAVIDHHPGKEPDDVDFVDIRPMAGACSSIITSYFRELSLEIPSDAATVLLTGLFRDTDCLTRGVSPLDVEAYGELFRKADNQRVNSMVLNNITMDDLSFYSYVLSNLKTEGDLAFCFIKKGCNQNLLGILGDFLLSLEEIRFTALFADNDKHINISFRNESEEISAVEVMKNIVSGIGSGGGHTQMAGGIINKTGKFDSEKIFREISEIVNR